MSLRFIIAIFFAVNSPIFAIAEVRVTQLDPPFSIGAFQETGDDPFSILSIDFNQDGQSDFRLSYGAGGPGVACYLNHPNQIVILRSGPAYPGQTNVYGSMGALPLGTIVGSNLVSSVDLSAYSWHSGNTNDYDLTAIFGDHQSSVVGVVDPVTIGMPPVAAGDPVAKEGVMGFQFLIGTNIHYGYLHFDFRTNINQWYMGAGGYIMGWAFETEPHTPIAAKPIAVPPTPFQVNALGLSNGVFHLRWLATPGATFLIEGTTSLSQPLSTFTSEFQTFPTYRASQVFVDLSILGMTNHAAYFWRVKRVH